MASTGGHLLLVLVASSLIQLSNGEPGCAGFGWTLLADGGCYKPFTYFLTPDQVKSFPYEFCNLCSI
jgi:hypothetical protein